MKVLIFFSGGKDSHASLIHSIKTYGVENCEAVFCDTGWENPVTYSHIVSTCKKWKVKLTILKNKKYDGMIDLAVQKKRFPSTKSRFCTEELKSKPAIDYVLSHSENIITIEGIRRNESLSRSKMLSQCTYFKYYFEPYGKDKTGKNKFHTYRKKEILEWCKKYNADKIRPIFSWSAEETINFILENNDTPNPLYYQGFKRVGCFPCIMAQHSELKLIIENHPEQWKRLQEAEIKAKSSFMHPNYIPKRFQTGLSKKGDSFPTSDDIKNYLKQHTADMFETETPSCLSAYNLCE